MAAITTGTTAPKAISLDEQTGKVESGYSSVQHGISGIRHRKPLIEDYVFYAEQQRAHEKVVDDKQCGDHNPAF
ncbi:hypothetical protein LTR78_005062 [Recurvomyces mirabilis]|uniref:Uncharacterized protein n=1 Tax=Recurvomyces mirabilis TaxID=574656 RepID=A0AAE0WNS1_9PEZI|nr:hypothetical protein LTR78_005062 [Recurvomyces mirabilis]KAK5158322.1 hypothetical protein LTS14_003340 [Recurvomyces mirabilis]